MNLKLLPFFSLLFLMSDLAWAKGHMPTIYGKLARELRYVDQEERFNYSSDIQSMNVGNGGESRLGAKNRYEFKKLNFSYQFELGIDSTNDTATDSAASSGSGRIRVRLAQGKLKSKWGSLIIGQAFTPTAKLMRKRLDPLAGTTFGQQGVAQKDDIKTPSNQPKSLGYLDRARKDGVGYKTPNLKGFSLTVWTDSNDELGRDNSSNVNDPYYEFLLKYEKDLNNFNLGLYSSYTKWVADGSNENSNLMFGGRGLYEMMSLSLAYSTEETKTGIQTSETKRLLVALSKKYGSHKTSLTYANKDIDGGDASVMTDDSTVEQIAVGQFYHYNKNITFHLTLGRLEFEESDPTLALSNDNEATIVASGLTFIF